MSTFYLVRHGEPDYSAVTQKQFVGHGRDLAGLTAAGEEQARRAAEGLERVNAKLIVSSPYTRALQTAAIISRALDLDLRVELDLHEWLPDLTFKYRSVEEVLKASREFEGNGGEYPPGQQRNWESGSMISRRVKACLKKYLSYETVIVVCHGLVIRQLTGLKSVDYCQVVKARL